MDESKIKVGVLRGGPSSEYEVSLKTGASVLRNVPDEKYSPVDVFISKDGEWHVGGLVREPHEALRQVDVVFNALHGEYGEDGKVEHLLETFNVPFTGSGKVASALAMNKLLTKKQLEFQGIKMPRHVVVRKSDGITESVGKIFRKISPPYVVKPIALGSSVGVSIARTVPDLEPALRSTLSVSREALVEEFIFGREATCGVIEGFRGEELYSLFPIEIIPPEKNKFYDYEAKYLSNDTGYKIPGGFTDEEKEQIQSVAALAHRELGLRHYSRSDFIVHPKRGVFFLEVNTLPGLTDHSLIPKSLVAAGSGLPEFLDHVLTLALERR